MDNSSKNALLIWLATIGSSAGASWATTRLGANLGLRLGPWGAIAGAVIGAVAGATLSKRMLEQGEGPAPVEADRAES